MNWIVAGGSLAAVLLLAAMARLLKLGGDPRIADTDAALELARQAQFEPTDIVIDRAGVGALAQDAQGRFLLIRRHGAHFVGEPLSSTASGRLDQRFLVLGKTVLDLGDAAPIWAARLRTLA